MKRFMGALALAATIAFPALAQTGQGSGAAGTAVVAASASAHMNRFIIHSPHCGRSGDPDRGIIGGRNFSPRSRLQEREQVWNKSAQGAQTAYKGVACGYPDVD